MAGHRVSLHISGAAADEKEVYDGAGRACDGRGVHAGRLRHFPPRLPLAHYLRRAQPVPRSAVDVGQLRVHEFHVDMAVAVKGRAPVRVVAADPRLVVLLPAADADLRPRRGADNHPAHDRRVPRLHGADTLRRLPRRYNL